MKWPFRSPIFAFISDSQARLHFACVALLFVVCGCLKCKWITAVNGQSFVEDICDGIPNGTLVIDPESCSGFYVCSDDVLLELVTCPENLWFNPAIQTCDFPENFVCHLFVTTPTVTSPSTSTIVTRDPNVEDGIYCPSIENPHAIQFIPSLIDCERYYICYYGQPHPMSCLEGYYWNQARRMCDYPANANCALDPMPIGSVCARSSSGEPTIVPHPTQCELYFYCVNGVAEVQQCPFLFHFDFEEQSCLMRDRAHCFANRNRAP